MKGVINDNIAAMLNVLTLAEIESQDLSSRAEDRLDDRIDEQLADAEDVLQTMEKDTAVKRPLDEVLREQGVDVYGEGEPEVADIQDELSVGDMHTIKAKLQMIEGTDHAESMDDLHQEVLQHARDLMTYGFNLDHPRARGIFEIAASLYGHALTAKNSKRDAQLKAMKLALDRKRVDLEEKRTNHVIGQIDASPALSDDGVMVADRNDLLRRMRNGEL